MDTKDQQSNNPQPAAYDVEGRPLYYHPPQDGQPEEPEPTTAQRPSHVTVLPESMEGQNFDPRIRSQYANEPDVVHTVRNLEPQPMVISEELKRKHEESVAQYPQLNLSEGEYVILDIKRHPIGIVAPIAITVIIWLCFSVSVANHWWKFTASTVSNSYVWYRDLVRYIGGVGWSSGTLGLPAEPILYDQRERDPRNSRKLVFSPRANS